jgi:hypothetical protein
VEAAEDLEAAAAAEAKASSRVSKMLVVSPWLELALSRGGLAGTTSAVGRGEVEASASEERRGEEATSEEGRGVRAGTV